MNFIFDTKYGELIGLFENAALREPTSGLFLDDFDLQQTIGTGSFGQVFYARQKSTEITVAFKLGWEVIIKWIQHTEEILFSV